MKQTKSRPTLAAARNRAEKAYLGDLMGRYPSIRPAALEAGCAPATLWRLLVKHGFGRNRRRVVATGWGA